MHKRTTITEEVAMYFLAINKIKKGTDPAEIGKTIPPHIQWTKKQIAEGRIAQAGKWGDSGGMAIVRSESLVETERLLAEDPLIQAGLVTYEVARLYPDVEI